MRPWRVLISLAFGCLLVLPQFTLAADDQCGSAGPGEANAPDYIVGPDEGYQLEQPFGGVANVASIGEYIQLVYQFALGIVGIIAVVLIMFGGVRWIAAAGNESVISEAKEIITSAVTGLMIALLSYVILAFINPQTLDTDVSVFKIPIPLKCSFTPTLVPIPDSLGLAGNGAQACPNFVAALQRVATAMRTEPTNPGYCPTCTIQVGNAYRSPESQEPIYACYQKCVQQGYISSDGLQRLKSGTPDGCNSCVKAAAPCCSNHNKGLAADLYFSVGGVLTLMDITSGYVGDQASNNGASGGRVNYANCDGTANPLLCYSQKKLYDAMLATGDFSNYSAEWWHFDYQGECGTENVSITYCDAYTPGDYSSTASEEHGLANSAYCFAVKSDGTKLYRNALCDNHVPSCIENFGGYTWYLAGINSCGITLFANARPGPLADTYIDPPYSCSN